MKVFILVLLTSIMTFADVVTLDTSSLIDNASFGPFTLDFTFIDGSGTGDGNNTITLSDFVLGAGSLTLSSSTGGVTVGASPFTVTLTDTSFYNDVQFTFVPDASLSFNIDATSNPDDGTPDAFTVGIIDRKFYNIPTTNPNSGIAFVEYDLPTTDPTAGTQVILSGSVSNNDEITIPAPTPSAVPEPSAIALLGLVLSILTTRFLVGKHTT
jgi:hypothetical protein